jgi:CBS domain-containing protein
LARATARAPAVKEHPRVKGAAVDEAFDFLRKVPPFQFLDDRPLRELSAAVSLEYYPTGALILEQNGPPSEHLLVIKKGGAKVFVRAEGSEETLVDYRAEGDVIGFLSLYTGDRSRTNVVATSDTICYLIDKPDFRRLLDANPQIREYLHRTFLSKYLDKTLHEMRTRSILAGGGERLLFTTPVGELATGAVVTVPAGLSIQAAAEVMSRNRISSLIVLDGAGKPSGIITDRDIRDKVVATGREVSGPATDIMSSPLVTMDARDYCFEALLTMIRHNIHHLLIVESEAVRGIITNHDLMILQGTSPLSVVQEIEHQQDVPGLALASGKVNQIIGLLLKEGARAANITPVVAEIDDRIVRRVLEIAERRFGPAPVRYAWLAIGSEGRREQVFRTDQDNALLLDDAADPDAAAAGERWAAKVAAFATETLIACGFPPCPAGIMVSNPVWRRPLQAWRRHFSDWIQDPAGASPIRTSAFFDFRVVHGDELLGERLRDHVVAQIEDQPQFLNYVVNQIVTNRPPIGFFGSFVVEKSGEHKDQLNLKARGINPLVDLVRFFALEKGIRATSTVERLDALRETHTVVREHADELQQALDFLLLLRVHNQYRQMSDGVALDNFITPSRLTNLEKRTIKEAFQLISRVQDLVLERYKTAVL